MTKLTLNEMVKKMVEDNKPIPVITKVLHDSIDSIEEDIQ